MIENVLSFILGFLAAAGLALLVAPVLWRRAGELMRRRVEASIPMTREELEAEIDGVRAGYAMAVRRLEMKIEALHGKTIDDFVEINRLREEISSLQDLNAERDAAISGLEAERGELEARLAERDVELRTMGEKLAQIESQIRERKSEVEELSRLYEESSLTASMRQVELVGREADIERLNDSINLLRNQRKEADRVIRDAMAEKAKAEEALRIERTRAAELERKLDGMIAALSSREEKLDRRETEIARLKQKLDAAGGGNPGPADEADDETARLEARVAQVSQELSSLLKSNGKGGKGAAFGMRKSETERLQSRLTTLMRENRKLRAELAGAASVEGTGDQALRERIADLAAEVVNLTATLEGPASPIEKALALEIPSQQGERPPSLADRVKTLRGSAAG
ncbi:hypothetical protein [Chelativorans sp. AA-79]|uniref:hypothetical protein n=1 Tax=Chelativorans sp. AA-79 TaxID=3028735 RepID=UPI0023FA41DB|nr:hypothetical protein [Chelativorans sp. AA-79]WEX07960.1 hypothetical protein PVE73_17910 [Chelativorans sp. AA-79]